MLLVVRGSFTPPVVREEDVTRHGPVHHVGGAHRCGICLASIRLSMSRYGITNYFMNLAHWY